MTEYVAELKIEAPMNDDDTPVTGTFQMRGNLTVRERTVTDYLLDSAAERTNAVLQDFVFGKNSRRRGIYIDLGEGDHIFEFDFNGWEGSGDTWGDGSGSLPADGTGHGPVTQMQVLQNYLRKGTTDSINPAELRFGEYATNGGFNDEVLYVTVNPPSTVHSAEDHSTFDGSITCKEVVQLDILHDEIQQLQF